MSASPPVSTVKYYVLAHSQKEFVQWVKLRGKGLQACNYLGTMAAMKGLSFESPDVELVVVGDAAAGKGMEFYQDLCRLVSRYCVDKRKHDCIRDSLV